MNYEIHIKQVPPQVVVTERRHTTLAQLGEVMHETLAHVATAVDPPGAARGAPFAVYYDEPFRPEDIDLEVGLPVTADAKVVETLQVQRRLLEGGPVAYTVHVGPYEAIGAAYEALYRWVDAHGHHRLGPPKEIYLAGPGEGIEPANYRTELEVPVD